MMPDAEQQGRELSADSILAELARLNIVLSVEAGKLRFRAQVGALTAELREAIARRRVEIIRRLTTTEPATPPVPDRPFAVRCAAHIEARDWIDATAPLGRVRTTCRQCGAFVGYRPDNANPA